MSRPAPAPEMTPDAEEAIFDEMTVAVAYEAVIDLIELLGYLAAVCSAGRPGLDAGITAAGGGLDAAALASRAAATAWALSATVGLADPYPLPAL